MVHFPPLPSPAYVFSRRYGGITRRGFPHSDIPGSQLICNSPRLIAAYRVLHRLPAPRHSPYALSSLNIGIRTDPEAHCIRATGPVLLPTLTHCVCSLICGSEKTTVCRIFSCQRTPGGATAAGKHQQDRASRGDLPLTLVGPPPPGARCAHGFGGRPSRLPPHWPASRSGERLARAGGEYRDRTGDLLVANQALSQLS